MSPSEKSFTMYVILGLKIYLIKNWIVKEYKYEKLTIWDILHKVNRN